MKIILLGKLKEVEQYANKLNKDEEYQCISISEPYKDRGKNDTYRLDTEVERREKISDNKKIAGVDVNFLISEARKFANAKTPKEEFPSYTRSGNGNWKNKK